MIEQYKQRPHDFTRTIVAEGYESDIRKFESILLQKLNVRLDESFYNRHQNDGLYFDGWKKGQFSDQHRKNMSNSASKRKRTDDHIKKLQEGRRNSKNSEEHILAIKKHNTGKKLDEVTKEKIKKSRIENNDTKLLASHAGKISSEKYKNDLERQKNHSERMKQWWQKRKLEQEDKNK